MKAPKPMDESIFMDVLSTSRQEIKRILMEDFVLATSGYTFWGIFMYITGTFFPIVPSPAYVDGPLFGTPVGQRLAFILYLLFVTYISITGLIVLFGLMQEKLPCLHIGYLCHSALTVFAAGFLIFAVVWFPNNQNIFYIGFLICPIIYRAGRIGYIRSYIVALDYFIMKSKDDDGRGYFQWSDPVKNNLYDYLKVEHEEVTAERETNEMRNTRSWHKRIMCCGKTKKQTIN